jgi:ABC-type multidrug transport system fused ATPase/permease subunit
MRALAKLNPYLWKYRGRLGLGLVFIVLANLFAVYSPQVVREAIDTMQVAYDQLGRPAAERALPEPSTLRLWIGWTGLDITARLDELGTREAILTCARRSSW